MCRARLSGHSESTNLLTFSGFGSRIRVINFMAPKESQGGHVNSAEDIWTCQTVNGQKLQQNQKPMQENHKDVHLFIQVHNIRIIERQVACKQYEKYDSTGPQVCICSIISSIVKYLRGVHYNQKRLQQKQER